MLWNHQTFGTLRTPETFGVIKPLRPPNFGILGTPKPLEPTLWVPPNPWDSPNPLRPTKSLGSSNLGNHQTFDAQGPPNLTSHQTHPHNPLPLLNPPVVLGGPRSPGLASVTPINDLHGTEGPALAKGERLMRCKVGSIHRLLDLYGWAQLGHAAVTVSAPKPRRGDLGLFGGNLGMFWLFRGLLVPAGLVQARHNWDMLLSLRQNVTDPEK